MAATPPSGVNPHAVCATNSYFNCVGYLLFRSPKNTLLPHVPNCLQHRREVSAPEVPLPHQTKKPGHARPEQGDGTRLGRHVRAVFAGR